MTTATEVVVEDEVIYEGEPEAINVNEEVDVELDEADPRTAIYEKREAQVREQAGVKEPDEKPEKEPVVESDEVMVTINGREKLVAQSRIDAAGGLAAYQKSAAASEMLNTAATEMRRVNEKLAQLDERERQLAFREQQTKESVRTEPPNTDALKEMATKYHEAILEGDVDIANELLLKMQATQSAMVNNSDEAAEKAVRRARSEIAFENNRDKQQRFAAEVDEANSDFRERFPDIADDPVLSDIANRKTIELQTAHPDWMPKTIITEAAQSVRDWFSKRTAISTTETKIAAKRSQDAVRGGTARAVPRPAPPPQTKGSYVESLRKARGLE